MNRISEILVESLQFLRQEPRLFLPKLASTFLSSIWLIGFISGHLTQFHMLVLTPFILVLGVFVSVMLASMVKNRESKNMLRKGFSEALSSWKAVLPAALFFMIISFVTVIPLGLGLTYFVQFGNLTALIAGTMVSLALVVAVSFASYFLPITLLEKKSFISGFGKSIQSSRKNSKSVLLLTLFSIALLGLAFGSSKALQTLGYLGFLVGRLLATTVNTYLFVVSPSYYLGEN